MATPTVPTAFVRGTANLQGLVNANFYALSPTATPINLGASLTIASVNAAGLTPGYGIYALNTDARLVDYAVSTAALTGIAGGTLTFYPITYPLFQQSTTSPIWGNPATGIALSASANVLRRQMVLPTTGSSAAAVVTGGSGEIAYHYFLPLITATTFPSAAGLVDILIESW